MLGHDICRAFGGDPARATEAVKAKVTVILAAQDYIVNPAPALEFARALRAAVVELTTACGHLATGCQSPGSTQQWRRRSKSATQKRGLGQG
jgi:homoserine O-acetyltransferase